MRLSECAVDAVVIRDTDFSSLGYVDSDCAGVLAYADTLKYLHKARSNPNVACLITTEELAGMAAGIPGLMVAESPRTTFYIIHRRFVSESRYTYPFEPGIGAGCDIHPSAIIAEGCRIGDNVKIGEQVVIRPSVWIGDNVTIEAGAKIGVEGILYDKTSDGPRLIPHGGYVRIHDHAILMANSIVVRSIHDTEATEVGAGALVGLASIVGHEAKIRKHAVISNQCVLARRCVIGMGAFLGTQTMIKEYVCVGDNARVMTGSVVIGDVPPEATVSGNFATAHNSRMLEHLRLSRENSRGAAPRKLDGGEV